MTERSIVLLRHAKAERPTGAADADRPLTARGHADAAAAGAWLAHGGYLPEVVICSPAKRTRQTWHDVALGMAEPLRALAASVPPEKAPPPDPIEPPGGPRRVHPGPTVRYERRVYSGPADDLLALLRTVEPAAGTVLLVGHNPSISDLSGLLDPVHADPDGLRTSGIAVHGVPGEWAELTGDDAPLTKWYTARG
jgi:phosphohistidine phosphatase